MTDAILMAKMSYLWRRDYQRILQKGCMYLRVREEAGARHQAYPDVEPSTNVAINRVQQRQEFRAYENLALSISASVARRFSLSVSRLAQSSSERVSSSACLPSASWSLEVITGRVRSWAETRSRQRDLPVSPLVL